MKWGDFVGNILKEKHKQKDNDVDVTLEKTHLKKRFVKLLMMIVEVRSSNEDQVLISLNKKEEYIEKPELMLGQAREMLKDPERAGPFQFHEKKVIQ